MEKVKLSLKKFWKKIVATVIAISLLLGGILIARDLFPPTPPTGDVTQTSFTSLAADGYIRNSSTFATWAPAYSANMGTVSSTTAAGIYGGRRYVTVNCYIYRGFLFFDATTLPSGTTITSVILSLNFTVISTSASTFNVTIYTPESSYAYPSNPLVATDYDYLNYDSSVEVGRISSASITTKVYTNITLTTSSVNLTAITKLICRTDEEQLNNTYTEVGSNEYWVANAQEATGLGIPTLYVSYTTPSCGTYGTTGVYALSNVTFYSYWSGTDFTGCYGNFTSNCTGYESFSGLLSSAWYNVSVVLPATGTVIMYSFGANDTSNRWGNTGNLYVTVTAVPTSITVVPAGTGDQNECDNSAANATTGNWKFTDENDTTTAYVLTYSSDNPGSTVEIDDYAMQNIILPSGIDVLNVTVYGEAKCRYGNLDTYFYCLLRMGSTNYLGSGETCTTTWQTFHHSWTTNPAGGNWNASSVLALKAGFKLDVDNDAIIPEEGWCTYVCVVVTTAPSVAPVSDSSGASVNYVSTNVTFYSHWTCSSAMGINGNFTWNGTGVPETLTGSVSGNWFNYSIMTPYTEGVVIQFSLGADNVYGQWGYTGLINITLTATKYSIPGVYCDIHQNSTAKYTTEPALQVGYDGTQGANISWLWLDVGVTAFSHVVNATLELQAYSTSTTAQSWVRIYGFREIQEFDATEWAGITNPFTRYTKTVAYVDWQLPNVTAGTNYSTPNLAAIIEEITSMDGWLHDYGIALEMEYLNGSTVRYFKSHDNGYAAGLYVAWNFLPEVQPYWAGVQNYYTNVTVACGWDVLFSYQWYYWRQTSGMSMFCYETNNSAVLTNSSFAAVSAGASNYYYWTNFSFVINSGNPYSIALKPYANASENLWGYLNTEYVKPIFFNYNATAQSLFDAVNPSGSSLVAKYGLAHTTGRKVFYDNNSDVFIAFYSDSYNMTVAFTENGVTWQNITAFRECIMGDHFYVDIEPCTGYTYIHYQFGYEGQSGKDCKVWYRRGNLTESPAHNYSIVWQTDESIVYDPTGGADENGTYPEGIVVDKTGYVYMVLSNTSTTVPTHDNLTMFLYKNDWKNGTWANATGFPKNITTNRGLWEDCPLVLSDNTIAVVEGPGDALGPETEYFGNLETWFWNGSTLWNETSSTVDTFYRDSMSAVVDDTDQIHVVYHSSDGRILYSRRTAAGVWDLGEAVVATRDVGETYSNDNGIWTVPQLGFNPDDNRIFCTWLANDTYLYASYKDVDSDVWISDPVRTLNITGITIAAMPNVCNARAVNNHLLFIVYTGVTTSTLNFYSYYYNTSLIAYDTYLVEGWNTFTATTLDVSKTLSQIDVSFDSDGISWAVITVDYNNGTQWSLINGTTYNGEKTVTIGSTLNLYCLDVIAVWTHEYE